MKEQCFSSQQLEFLHLNGFPSWATVISFRIVKKGVFTGLHPLKSENHVQNKAFSYASVLVVLFPIFVALKISNHVERV